MSGYIKIFVFICMYYWSVLSKSTIEATGTKLGLG